MDPVKVAQAYALLTSLRDNLPKDFTIEEKYVEQFHAVLETLERESSHKLDSFRVPASEVRHRLEGKNDLTGDRFYSDNPECERAFFVMKLDAVLNFFSIQEKGKTIGFTA